jgi:DNA-binding NarL/FixJ family response regulator
MPQKPSPPLISQILDWLRTFRYAFGSAWRAARAGHRLSRRQREVARLAGEGLTNREIAARLSLSEDTVKTHLNTIYKKLGLTNRRELETWPFKKWL